MVLLSLTVPFIGLGSLPKDFMRLQRKGKIKMKKVLFLVCLALAGSTFLSSAAATGVVTQRYAGVIIATDGPQPDALPIGATVLVTYTVDPGASDSEPHPDEGLYEAGLQSLVFQLPEVGYELVVENGAALITDEVFDYENVIFFRGNVVADPLGGLPVVDASLYFTRYIGELDMIASQALPLHPLEADEVWMTIYTEVGGTIFKLRLDSLQPTVNEAISAATQRIADLITTDQLNHGVGNSLQVKLESVLAAHEAGRNACGRLTGLRNQIGNMPRRSEAESAMVDELDALVGVVRQALGGC